MTFVFIIITRLSYIVTVAQDWIPKKCWHSQSVSVASQNGAFIAFALGCRNKSVVEILLWNNLVPRKRNPSGLLGNLYALL